MGKKLTPENLGDFAKSNPYLDMRLVEEWRAIKREMERLGVDLSGRRAPAPAPKRSPFPQQPIIRRRFIKFRRER